MNIIINTLRKFTNNESFHVVCSILKIWNLIFTNIKFSYLTEQTCPMTKHIQFWWDLLDFPVTTHQTAWAFTIVTIISIFNHSITNFDVFFSTRFGSKIRILWTKVRDFLHTRQNLSVKKLTQFVFLLLILINFWKTT